MRTFFVLLSVVGFVGCGSEMQLKSGPVGIVGQVSQSGRPTGGLTLVFHPLGDGHVREVAVQKDGTFQGEIVPGEYAYYVAKPTIAGTQARKIAPAYFEADLARIVAVESGKQLAIALD